MSDGSGGWVQPNGSVRLAVLLDAENVGYRCWPAVMRVAAVLGCPTVMRAYTYQPATDGCHISGLQVIDGRAVAGTNAADFLLAMDAAVLLAERRVDGFVLVSGDDGFAVIAYDLKRRGARVYALIPLDRPTVPRRFAAAADLAILIPVGPITEPPAVPDPAQAPVPGASADDLGSRIAEVLGRCESEQPGGWVNLGVLGTALKQARVKRPKGRLADVLKNLPTVEFNGKTGAKACVRRRGAELVEMGFGIPDQTIDGDRDDDDSDMIPF